MASGTCQRTHVRQSTAGKTGTDRVSGGLQHRNGKLNGSIRKFFQVRDKRNCSQGGS